MITSQTVAEKKGTKKILTRQEMIDAGILKPGPDPVVRRRVKLPYRKEKPMVVLPPRGEVWYDD